MGMTIISPQPLASPLPNLVCKKASSGPNYKGYFIPSHSVDFTLSPTCPPALTLSFFLQDQTYTSPARKVLTTVISVKIYFYYT